MSRYTLVVLAVLWGCGGGGGAAADSGAPDAPDIPPVPLDSTNPDADLGPDSGPVDGTPCDDQDPCTRDDQFSGGVCRGTPYECAPLAPCVTRKCDGLGGCLIEAIESGSCFIEGACWSSGQPNPDDACLACSPAVSQDAWTAKACDDQDPCTVGDRCIGGVCEPGDTMLDCDDSNPCTVDRCVPGQGCAHDEDPAQACDDHNPCTAETCDPVAGCRHDAVAGACEDGDPCTLDDFCEGGVCKPGAGARDCDDQNPCTDDSCRATVGCIHVRLAGTCDDGFACTEDDRCLGGECVGQKTLSCPPCEYHANADANKAVVLELGASGHPGDGLDLDGDPMTCAPSTDCSGGVDNELGLLAPFVNEGLMAAVQQGVLTYVVEFEDPDPEDDAFAMHFLASEPADPTCDFQHQECDYFPLWEALDATCSPVVSFDNARRTGSRITAGGPGYTFALRATLIGGGHLDLAILNARFEAEASVSSGGVIRTLDGFLGGGVEKQALLDTVAQLPAEVFYPMDLAQVLSVLDQLIVEDLDTDLDGEPDAASVAIQFKSIPANVVPRP